MIRNYFLPLLFTTVCWFFFAGCSSKPKEATAKKPLITVSIAPIAYFTEAIAGDYCEVATMIRAGFSPESYEPTAQQLMRLNQSSAYFSTPGIGFELQWMERMHTMVPSMTIYDMSAGISLVHPHKTGPVDPHIWTSVRTAKKICHTIANSLAAIDTLHAAYYQLRNDSMQHVLTVLDKKIEQTLLHASHNRSFAIYHPSLTYFAQDYGLQQFPLEQEGKEPAVSDVHAFIMRCKAANVKTVFLQEEFSEEQVRTIATEIGARTVRVSPLSYQWDKQMLHLLKALCDE
ncbi:MAG: zinc ABC transporter substrate-binding protein [Bacteroidaceae bacterium]|nr:zinc ABC transporter substrate-binding protein [Bacteroidaceae bacterium]